MKKGVPEISIMRLAIYFRFLNEYAREKGPDSTINSEDLARRLDMNPHQIRKDLSYFGRFGAPGVGYRTIELKDKIAVILGLDKKWNMCLCGAGNLGSALCAYRGFRQLNLNIVAIFDNDPRKIGKTIQGIPIYSHKDIKRVASRLKITIGIIAVPLAAAQDTADELTHAGIRAILNFAPLALNVPRSVKPRNVDLSNELVNLTHFLVDK